MRTLTAIILGFVFSSGIEAIGLERCDCSYTSWQGDCNATIKLEKRSVVLTTDALPCARVDWYYNGVPQVILVTDGSGIAKLPGQSKTPRLEVESCKICTHNRPLTATGNTAPFQCPTTVKHALTRGMTNGHSRW